MSDSSMNVSSVIRQQINAEILSDTLLEAVQEDSAALRQTDVDENSVAGMQARTKKLVPENKARAKHVEKIEKGLFSRKEEANELADGFCNREENKEYKLPAASLSRLALSLGNVINPDTSADALIDIIKTELKKDKVQVDVSEINKTLTFLLEVVQFKLGSAEGMQASFLEKIYENIVKTQLQYYERYRAEIESGDSLAGVANVLIIGDGSRKESLDHLRKMTNEHQDVFTKVKYYVSKGYNFAKMRAEFKLLFNYMGGLVKGKLENAHLKQLLEEIKVLQSVLGVYKQSEREFQTMFVHLKRTAGLFK